MQGMCRAQGTCLLWETLQRQRQTQPSLAGFGVSISLAEAVKQCVAAKRGANLRPVYLKSLTYYLNRFALGRELSPLESIGSREVETFLAQFPQASTRATWLNRVSTLFSFAVRRDLLAKNPCDRLERISVDRRAPFVLSPGQSQLLLKVTPSVMRAYVILGLFAGIRPDELLKLQWADVDLETKTVTVNDAKTRRRRIVALHEKAVALLADCPLRSGPVAPSNSTVRRFKRTARAALGLEKWPSDLLRHTAASYLLALHGDAGKVATMLGNSSSVLLSHYHQPVRNGDCGHFWAGEGKPTL